MLAVARGVRRRVVAHDRRAARLCEHLTLWTRDRDARLRAAAGGPEEFRAALREYRDEARRVRREHRRLHAAEGRLHARRRRRLETPLPRLVLPEDCLVLVDDWRERAQEGQPRHALESRLPRLVAGRRAA